MLIVLAHVGRLGALLADDAELLGGEDGLPLGICLLDRVVGGGGHVCFCAAGEEGAEEGEGGHGTEECGG